MQFIIIRYYYYYNNSSAIRVTQYTLYLYVLYTYSYIIMYDVNYYLCIMMYRKQEKWAKWEKNYSKT